ncbi:MAG TPA: glutamate racemase [Candidatus Obscuribacterales bacterium]
MAQTSDHRNGERLRKSSRIGLFDSGLGGLSVLTRLAAAINPEERHQFIYLGDTARCPYGDRSPQEIVLFVKQIVNWLITQDVDSIVMACNTSAAVSLDLARQISPVPVYDLISPTAQFIAGRFNKVAVMATASTIKSQAFSRSLRAINAEMGIVDLPCPDLVPLIESGQCGSPASREALKRYAERLLEERVEAVILGCTHFPFLRSQIVELTGDEVEIIDPAETLVLSMNPLPPPKEDMPAKKFGDSAAYALNSRSIINTTGNPSKFRETAKICLGYALDTIIGITVDELTAAAPTPKVLDGKVNANTVTPNMVPAT